MASQGRVGQDWVLVQPVLELGELEPVMICVLCADWSENISVYPRLGGMWYNIRNCRQ